MPHLPYPSAPKSDTAEILHGTLVKDPFRPLEDSCSPETIEWLDRQGEFLAEYFKDVPERDSLRTSMREFVNYPKASVPWRRGQSQFIFRNDGLQEQNVLYVSTNNDSDERILIDQNEWQESHETISHLEATNDGTLLAYGVSTGGSDWSTWKVRDVATGLDLPDVIKHSKNMPVKWKVDNSGFFYSRFPERDMSSLQEENHNEKICFHVLGTPQSEDVLIYERPNEPDWRVKAERVTHDGRYLWGWYGDGCDPTAQRFIKSLDPEKEVIPFLEPTARYSLIHSEGDIFYLLTDADAPRGKIVEINVASPDKKNWKTLIAERREQLQSASFYGGKFLLHYSEASSSLVLIFDQQGKEEGKLPLPDVSSLTGLEGTPDNDEVYFGYSAFHLPTRVEKYFVSTHQTEEIWRAPIKFDVEPYETRRTTVKGKDGTEIPIYIACRKDIQLNGQNPTILYGYGGFGISMPLYFNAFCAKWLELGGIYVTACIRGGGEFGEEWHQAATKEKRQRAFDDFIECGEWLITEKYTSSQKLCLRGGSNGGLLVSVVANQRPDLCRAVICEVAVTDMLRFHKFTIGKGWIPDYGSPEDPEMFPHLYRYSPIHNIQNGIQYPAFLIDTADHDDRVVPLHSYKLAAALQNAQAGEYPILLRVDRNVGHGSGRALSALITGWADFLSFLMKELEMR